MLEEKEEERERRRTPIDFLVDRFTTVIGGLDNWVLDEGTSSTRRFRIVVSRESLNFSYN